MPTAPTTSPWLLARTTDGARVYIRRVQKTVYSYNDPVTGEHKPNEEPAAEHSDLTYVVYKHGRLGALCCVTDTARAARRYITERDAAGAPVPAPDTLQARLDRVRPDPAQFAAPYC